MAYSIETQDNPPLLRVTLRGFWTMEVFNAYLRDCGIAIQRLMATHARVDTLSDATDFPVQGPEVSEAFRKLKDMASQTPQNRVAIFSPSALGRMLAEHLVGSSHSKIFKTEAEALDWLGAETQVLPATIKMRAKSLSSN